jgi:hypothetical protein
LPIQAYSTRSLRRAPRLSTVLFLHVPELAPIDPSVDTDEPEYAIPPERWEKEGHRGLIYREYSRAGQTFWHRRVLSRTTANSAGQYYVGLRRRWQHCTRYEGRTVPWNVLVKVYKAAGMGLDWLEGGRNMSMDEAGWEVLREWRDSVIHSCKSWLEAWDEESIAEDEDYSEDEAQAGGDAFMMDPQFGAGGVHVDDDIYAVGAYDEDYDDFEPDQFYDEDFMY